MQIIEKQLKVLLVSSDDIIGYHNYWRPTEYVNISNLIHNSYQAAVQADIVIYKDPGGFQKILKNRYF